MITDFILMNSEDVLVIKEEDFYLQCSSPYLYLRENKGEEHSI
jgi:hypothetical protein